MWVLVSAMALAAAGYLLFGGTLPLRKRWREGTDGTEAREALGHSKHTSRPKKTLAWVTEQSFRVLGWSPDAVRVASIVSATASALAWWLITRNAVTGALMAAIGWQLPGFIAELRAAGALTTQVRQVSTFISTFADSLETGHTVGQAVDDGARAVVGAPLQQEAEMIIRRIHGGSSITDALRAMGETVHMPLWDLFVDLVGLNQEMGTSAALFRDLDWRLQEEDRMQVEFRTLIAAYMAIVALMLAIIVGSAPVQAMSDPRMWHYVTAHLGWIPLGATGIAVLVFGGLRKYARMRVAL